ncbi:MAG TPA: LysR family transcriptional regulator [Roseiarcus sp.]|jgi:DNA-binding transcriptional LysR family regulator
MTDLNSLVMFAKVVGAGSFTEAARRMNMPISTVSRRVAELEDQLGVRLLERSTRNLRLTELGAEVLEQAVRTAEINEAVENLVSNRRTDVSGVLRVSAMPSVSETLLTPVITAFQTFYPKVRIQVLVTERMVDLVAEGVDLVFRLGELKDSSLVAQKLLTYRHQLVASPSYLRSCKPPQHPQDLLQHRLLTFSYWKPEGSWTFIHKNGQDRETVTFQPHLSMNDFAGLAPALAAGLGIGDLPPVVQPGFMREGTLVELMPDWRFRTFDLSLVHVGKRHMSKPCRFFKEFATKMAPTLFPDLPA